jgi:hypothetical protein
VGEGGFCPPGYVSSDGFFLPDLDPVEVVSFFFVLLLYVWCKQVISGPGPW